MTFPTSMGEHLLFIAVLVAVISTYTIVTSVIALFNDDEV